VPARDNLKLTVPNIHFDSNLADDLQGLIAFLLFKSARKRQQAQASKSLKISKDGA